MINNVVIIGAGHNGLTCAAYLAKEGKQVTVLEAAEQVGGAAITREFAPGFKVSAGAHLLYMLDKNVRKELSLESAGLSFSQLDMKTVALAEDGNHLHISGKALQGAMITTSDQSAYQEYKRFMTRFAGVIGGMHNRIPPRVGTRNFSDLLTLAKTALNVRMLGKDDMREFLRVGGINIYDILQENFEHPLLKGALSLDGILGTNLGPRSNNSMFTALHRLSGLQGMAMPRMATRLPVWNYRMERKSLLMWLFPVLTPGQRFLICSVPVISKQALPEESAIFVCVVTRPSYTWH